MKEINEMKAQAYSQKCADNLKMKKINIIKDNMESSKINHLKNAQKLDKILSNKSKDNFTKKYSVCINNNSFKKKELYSSNIYYKKNSNDDSLSERLFFSKIKNTNSQNKKENKRFNKKNLSLDFQNLKNNKLILNQINTPLEFKTNISNNCTCKNGIDK